MRNLDTSTSKDPVIWDMLPALQSHPINLPLLPRLKTFKCKEATEQLIPFISAFLSPETIEISINFGGSYTKSPAVEIAGMITRLPTLCPKLESIALRNLPRDPFITGAVSEMLLACNRGSLRDFFVDSSLTKEAREVVCQLPKLSELYAIIKGHTPLPLAALPNLTAIEIEYDGNLDWLEGFRGATFGKLEEVFFHTESEQIGDFLGKFGSVALTTSAPNTLVVFGFYTTQCWNPTYLSLLPFRRLEQLEIESSCAGGCASNANDDVVIALAQAMPKLEILKLGGRPCRKSTGATINGLVALASLCPHLLELRAHIQPDTLIDAAATVVTRPPDGERVVQRKDCALMILDIGAPHVASESAPAIASTLLKIFPHIFQIKYTSWGWFRVEKAIKRARCKMAQGRLHDIQLS